jgi:hypothetical protein
VALAILALAIAPGYITANTWARSRTWRGQPSDLKLIIQSIVLSAVVQALLSPLIVLWMLPVHADLSNHPWRVTIWIVLSVVVVPIVLGVVGAALGNKVFNPSDLRVKGRWSELINKVLKAQTPPTVWDWLMQSERIPESAFMVVAFEDGTQIGGAFASDSMALTSPETHGLFLQVEWALDEQGHPFHVVEGSAGILIPSARDIRWIRILNGQGEIEFGKAETQEPDSGEQTAEETSD